jgi:hypothetical protein
MAPVWQQRIEHLGFGWVRIAVRDARRADRGFGGIDDGVAGATLLCGPLPCPLDPLERRLFRDIQWVE